MAATHEMGSGAAPPADTQDTGKRPPRGSHYGKRDGREGTAAPLGDAAPGTQDRAIGGP